MFFCFFLCQEIISTGDVENVKSPVVFQVDFSYGKTLPNAAGQFNRAKWQSNEFMSFFCNDTMIRKMVVQKFEKKKKIRFVFDMGVFIRKSSDKNVQIELAIGELGSAKMPMPVEMDDTRETPVKLEIVLDKTMFEQADAPKLIVTLTSIDD